MPGDLNLKKSWHPGLAKNKIKVQQAEKTAVEDLKARETRAADIQRTRELEQLKALQTGTPVKVGWIYESNQTSSQSMEQDIHKLLKKKPVKKSKKMPKMHESRGPVKASTDKSKADPMNDFLKR